MMEDYFSSTIMSDYCDGLKCKISTALWHGSQRVTLEDEEDEEDEGEEEVVPV